MSEGGGGGDEGGEESKEESKGGEGLGLLRLLVDRGGHEADGLVRNKAKGRVRSRVRVRVGDGGKGG